MDLETSLSCLSERQQITKVWSEISLPLHKRLLHIAPQEKQRLSQHKVQVMTEGQALVVCDKLIFSDYVAHVIYQSSGRLRGLYRFRNLLLKSAKVYHMQSVILSGFITAIHYVRVATGRILKLQNTAVRCIYSRFVQVFHSSRDFSPDSYGSLLQDAGMLHGPISLVSRGAATGNAYVICQYSFKATILNKKCTTIFTIKSPHTACMTEYPCALEWPVIQGMFLPYLALE
ncbi:hypothetical protein J6590_092812 [Homalodisca vitripennis]|nr:hypothetical protein J6590_092812 [Homalodisca vitripennis]